MREELSVILSNRAAAHLGNEDYISALADGETVIQIRKNWAKGHIRKAKALIGLKSYGEAIEAANIGLSYETDNTVRSPAFPPIQPFPHDVCLFRSLNRVSLRQRSYSRPVEVHRRVNEVRGWSSLNHPRINQRC